MMNGTPPFPPTECACPEDVANCLRAPAHLIPDDIPAIGEELVRQGRARDPAEVTEWLRASPGAVVGDSLTGALRRIGTIVPQMRNGRCVFLTEDLRCTIHAVAPFGCRYFDMHMGRAEGDRRSLWGLRVIDASAPYARLRQLLEIRDAQPALSERGKEE